MNLFIPKRGIHDKIDASLSLYRHRQHTDKETTLMKVKSHHHPKSNAPTLTVVTHIRLFTSVGTSVHGEVDTYTDVHQYGYGCVW